MHTGHEQSVFLGILQYALAGGDGSSLVHVVDGADLRPFQLESHAVHDVPRDEEFPDLENGMPGCMPAGIEGLYLARQFVAELEKVQSFFVCFHCFSDLRVAFGRHLHPSVVFGAGGIDRSIGEYWLITFHHAADVVAVEMGKIDVLNIGGFDSHACQSWQEFAVAASHSGIEKYFYTVGFHKESAHRGRYPFLQSQAVEQLLSGIGEGFCSLPACAVFYPRDFDVSYLPGLEGRRIRSCFFLRLSCSNKQEQKGEDKAGCLHNEDVLERFFMVAARLAVRQR